MLLQKRVVCTKLDIYISIIPEILWLFSDKTSHRKVESSIIYLLSKYVKCNVKTTWKNSKTKRILYYIMLYQVHPIWLGFELTKVHVQHHVKILVNDLRQVGGFLRVLQFPPPIKLTATI